MEFIENVRVFFFPKISFLNYRCVLYANASYIPVLPIRWDCYTNILSCLVFFYVPLKTKFMGLIGLLRCRGYLRYVSSPSTPYLGGLSFCFLQFQSRVFSLAMLSGGSRVTWPNYLTCCFWTGFTPTLALMLFLILSLLVMFSILLKISFLL